MKELKRSVMNASMPPDDYYLTIQQFTSVQLTEKGSKFLAFVYPVKSLETIKSLVADSRKRHYDASHVCYAYSLGHDTVTYKSADAGEPSGTAGPPILNQIKSFGLKNVLVIVVRYFGGTKLGVSGLIAAYKAAAQQALEASEKVQVPVLELMRLRFPFSQLNSIMKLTKENQAKVLDQQFECEHVELLLEIVRSRIVSIKEGCGAEVLLPRTNIVSDEE